MRPQLLDFDENSTIEVNSADPAKLEKTLVIACGALAREALAVFEANKLEQFDITCLPAKLHGSPMQIPERVRDKIRQHKKDYSRILCLYGDCGTNGALDRVLREEGVERIAGDHCYAFFAGLETYKQMDEDQFGTFFLTDFLVRHFEAFFLKDLKLDKYPEILDMIFGNFQRLVFLQQIPDPELRAKAVAIAARLKLPLEFADTGIGGVQSFLAAGNAGALTPAETSAVRR
ncbi:DUF1638 domain-containing protein [Mesorhizobium sp. VK23B]|uniref:DUF1638 domain-containing protein n=1 Tax=Mesorhizobium dulcispinae TaxID=3072316 RepID=A0ABU4XQT3_9HYPH|nr:MULTISPECIES: DUF1638 domain-containing protein [unclassified Mesorhizobium]MDX8470269.1 DUF1638 domain-containing protein [Mesorhizobium sp. VK23B]MDX8476676.1 DUF1638 domain-containing protein [Mesorhizobium sp. VK23A]